LLTHTRITLVFPPLWYYSTVPVALTQVGGDVTAAGFDVDLMDLNADCLKNTYGNDGVWDALQREETYRNAEKWDSLLLKLSATYQSIDARFSVVSHFRRLTFPEVDQADVNEAQNIASDPNRNPFWPTLRRRAQECVVKPPSHIAIAVIYPEQRSHALAFATALRQANYSGAISLYGQLHDQLSTSDWTADLHPEHAVFNYVDAVLIGDPGQAICRWVETQAKGCIHAEPNPQTVLRAIPLFSGLQREQYPFPHPVVDLRCSVGCPWARCTFCAIPHHHDGYISRPIEHALRVMQQAHETLGARWFRFRDDLLTPKQIQELGDAVVDAKLPIEWSARARFQPGFTESTLRRARQGGCSELWFGLESAVSSVREQMDKGVRDETVEQILDAAHRVGIRIRLLCMIGLPGERPEEAEATLQFIEANRHRLAGVSLSPFQLMRASPMGRSPERYGVSVLPDPIPREKRLRHTIPAWWEVDLNQVERLLKAHAAQEHSKPRPEASPGISHSWIGACLDGAL